ncbi:hypothetical protein [Ruminococcus sp. 2227st1_E6_2227SCRN_220401]|uniref:hypothetical protein n=1 Tax=unclassified Ruminococcus TaxID=2608920 RepID=UPI00319E56CA
MIDSEKQRLYQKIGTKVIHKKYGKGRITGSSNGKISVCFDSGKEAVFQIDMCEKLGLMSIVASEITGVQKNSHVREDEENQKPIALQSNILVEKITDELRSYYGSENKTEEVKLFLEILQSKVDVRELMGIDDQYDTLKNIFNDSNSLKEICEYIGNSLHVEALLKKILFCVDKEKFEKIVHEKRGFYSVLESLNIISKKISLNKKLEDYDSNSVLVHIARTYQMRNMNAHMCIKWTYQEVFNNLDSILITCIFAVEKNREKLLRYLEQNKTEDMLSCVEEYNDVYLWETKGQNSKCIVCDEKLEYSEKILLQYMIRNQIHSVQMTGKYCKTCGKVYVLKSDLLNELKKEEITSKDKGKKLRVKNKYVYGSTLVYDENGI